MVTPQADDRGAPAQPLSLRAYGRHRKELGLPGGNAVAVSRAIATQRLVSTVVYVDGVAQITDAGLADEEWARNTDHSRAPDSVKAQADGVTPAAVTGSVTANGVTPGRGRSRSQASPLVAASTREKNARADLAELEFLEKAKKLVAAHEVEKAWIEIVSQIRTAVLSVPSKAKLVLPHLSHADLAQLNDLLYQALEAAADAKPGTNGAAA